MVIIEKKLRQKIPKGVNGQRNCNETRFEQNMLYLIGFQMGEILKTSIFCI